MKRFMLILMVCVHHFCRSIAGEVPKIPRYAPVAVQLRDQYDAPQRLTFPATNVVVLTIADKKGSEQIHAWVAALKLRYAGRIELRGLADVGAVPGFLRGKVRKKFQETLAYPVMMDWTGEVCGQFGFQPGLANVLVIAGDGSIHARISGPFLEAGLGELSAAIEAALIRTLSAQSNSTRKPAALTLP